MSDRRIMVFGATGKTGTQIVRQALEAGHNVTAFVRNPTRLAISDPKLRVVTGDVLDAASVERGFAGGCDAVISALGVFHREPRTELSRGTANVICAMQQHGIRRLVVVSSLGAGDSKGQGSLLARVLQSFLLKHVLADKDRQEAEIMASGLDWTILRPPPAHRRARDQGRPGGLVRPSNPAEEDLEGVAGVRGPRGPASRRGEPVRTPGRQHLGPGIVLSGAESKQSRDWLLTLIPRAHPAWQAPRR